MTCLDLILDALARDPATTVRMDRRIFERSRLTIQGRRDLPVEKQLDLWAATHGLLCVHDTAAQCFTFSKLKTP